MNPRTTGLLALVVIGLGSFIYFYEIGGESARQAALDDAKRIYPGLSETDVEAVTLATGEGIEARFERHEGRWQVVSPVADRADAAALDAIVSALVRLPRAGSVATSGELAQYGLGPDARVVRFEVGGDEKGIRIGRSTPVGGGVYVARLGDDEVAYVETFRLNPLKRKLEDLRDRRIFGFDAVDVRTLRISRADEGSTSEVALARDSQGVWQMGVPITAPADEQTVRDLLADLSFLRARQFVDERSAEVEAALGEPWVTIHWTLDGDHLERSASIGGSLGGGRVIATDNGRVYTIEVERASDFDRTVSDYRDKMLAKFDVPAARRLVLDFAPTQPGEEPLRVVSGLSEQGWSGSEPRLDPTRAADLVQTLSNLRASDVFAEEMGPTELASIGLAPARVTIRVEDRSEPDAESAVLAEFSIGRLDATRGLFAKRAGGSTIYLLTAAQAEDLPISREAFARDFEFHPAIEKADGDGEGSEVDPAELESDPLEGVEFP